MRLIVKVLTKFLMSLIGLILTPLDNLISTHLPALGNTLSSVSSFFQWMIEFVLWVQSWLPFSQTFWSMLSGYIIFRLTVPLLVHTVKLVVQWWHALAP